MFTSSLFEPFSSVRHGFFTRNGGVSDGLFSSLNFALTKGDNRLNVLENQKILLTRLRTPQAQFYGLTQVHSNRVYVIDSPEKLAARNIEADALITPLKNVCLTILTADCVPVLLYSPDTNIIAAVHMGWRGAFRGILDNTFEQLRQMGVTSLLACIGPCIHQQSYEVGQDVRDQFMERSPDNASFFVPSSRAEHYLFDLPGFVKSCLSAYPSIQKIDVIERDTYTNPDLFFSCRRATHLNEPTFGCQASSICLV